MLSQKPYSFPESTLISEVKNKVLEDSNFKLKDFFNFGLFLPPSNGKAGKFLQEERILADYPFSSFVGYLELKYKQRIYRSISLNINKLKKIHSKTNLKAFIEYVQKNDCECVNKMVQKGLDPNYQFKETGVKLKSPREMIMILVSGGAHLDYRAVDSLTPLHKASIIGNIESIKTLLDLGQSPMCKDARGLTPLYHAIISDAPALCIERLLFDHSPLGVEDENGLQEIHQVCRNGRVQHLEHLLSYGANINSQTSISKDTPLHITTQSNMLNCARLLLFRGANKNLVNSSNQTPYQKAILLGNHDLANMIRDYCEEDVVPLRISPKLNERRRSVNRSQVRMNLPRSRSLSKIDYTSVSIGKSDSLSNNSTITKERSAHFISSANLDDLQEASVYPSYQSGSMKNLMNPMMSQHQTMPPTTFHQQPQNPKNNNIYQRVGLPYPQTTLMPKANESPQQQTIYGMDKTSNWNKSNLQASRSYGNLAMNIGDSNSDGSSGAASFIQQPQYYLNNNSSPQNPTYNETRNNYQTPPTNFNTMVMNQSRVDQNRYSLSSSSHTSMIELENILPRMVVLQKGNRGFGFVIRGMKGYTSDFMPSSEMPALQYLDQVEPDSVAHRAGLRPGDFILEVNDVNVASASHENVVDLIRNCGEMLALKVITIPNTDNPYNMQNKLKAGTNEKSQGPYHHHPMAPYHLPKAQMQSQQHLSYPSIQQQQAYNLHSANPNNNGMISGNYNGDYKSYFDENRLSSFSNQSFESALPLNHGQLSVNSQSTTNEPIIPKSYVNQQAKLTQTLDRKKTLNRSRISCNFASDLAASLIPASSPLTGCESPAAIASLRVPLPVSMGTPNIERYKHLIINSGTQQKRSCSIGKRTLLANGPQYEHADHHFDLIPPSNGNGSRQKDRNPRNRVQTPPSSARSSSSLTSSSEDELSEEIEPPLPPPPSNGSTSNERSNKKSLSSRDLTEDSKSLSKITHKTIRDDRTDFHANLKQMRQESSKALAKRREKIERQMREQEKREHSNQPTTSEQDDIRNNSESSFRLAAERFYEKALTRNIEESTQRFESENIKKKVRDIPLVINSNYARAKSEGPSSTSAKI